MFKPTFPLTSDEILEQMRRHIADDWRQNRLEQAREELNAPADDFKGAICAQWKRCGRANCRCANGELHGPYYYRFYRENGRLRKQYLSAKCPRNLQRIQEALAEREARVEYRQYLRQNAQWKADVREARALLKEMGESARFGERTLAQAKEQLRCKRQERSKYRSHRAKQ